MPGRLFLIQQSAGCELQHAGGADYDGALGLRQPANRLGGRAQKATAEFGVLLLLQTYNYLDKPAAGHKEGSLTWSPQMLACGCQGGCPEARLG